MSVYYFVVLACLSVFSSQLVWAQAKGVLENPRPGSYQSGVGVISGWVCEAEKIEVIFNGNAADRWRVGYGTRRMDTQKECGDSNNGFVLLFNWNLLGDGEHTVTAFVDDVELGRATVTVTTLGEEFRRDVSGTFTLPGFPDTETAVKVHWQEAQQNFVIADVIDNPYGPRHLTCEGEVVIEEAEIIDADTLTLCEERIRLIGIDAPERRQSCLDADDRCYPCGQVATEALIQKIRASNVVSCYLEPDVDRYGRALGICFSRDGTDLNGWLVANGHAVSYFSGPYMPHEEVASVKQRGVWAGEFIVPSEWRRGTRLEECEG